MTFHRGNQERSYISYLAKKALQVIVRIDKAYGTACGAIGIGLLSLLIAGCGASNRAPAGISVTVSPAEASILPGESQQFSSIVTGAPDPTVLWNVNGIPGGNSVVGSISANGKYTAPKIPPSSPVVTVTAASNVDPNRNARATIAIMANVVQVVPAAVSLPPAGTTQFVATVNGLNGTAVSWEVNGIPGGNSEIGTISSSGLYSAPLIVPAGGVVSVSANSLEDASASAKAIVTIAISFSIEPVKATVAVGETLQYSVQIIGEEGPPIQWAVNGIVGGSTAVGIINSIGTYSAPSSIPSATVTVSATDLSGAAPPAFGIVNLFDPVLDEAHSQWLKGVATVAASYGCTDISVQQNATESLSETITRFGKVANEGSCIVLWPISIDPSTIRYSEAWGGMIEGKDIIYISDVNRMRIWNSRPATVDVTDNASSMRRTMAAGRLDEGGSL